MPNSFEMPLYQSHKKVRALKIAAIDQEHESLAATITPTEEGYPPFIVGPKYMAKHKPEVGGYFVQYEDGYNSFSPAQAFEEGYTRI